MKYSKVIVSLTSYPKRIPYAQHTIETILHQTISPDAIILTLVKDEFEGVSDEISSILDLIESAGVAICWQEKNLRPHNKYLWTMKAHPDDIMITVDDDIVYPLTLIQTLLETHYLHPEAIIANRAHIVTKYGDDELAPYSKWILEQSEYVDEPRSDLIATGVGGVLYPPHLFDDEVFDIRMIEETSLLADDLWLQVHELRLGIPVVATHASPHLNYVPGSQDEGLYQENLDNGRNDLILKRLFRQYPEIESKLLEVARTISRENLREEGNPMGTVRGLISRLRKG